MHSSFAKGGFQKKAKLNLNVGKEVFQHSVVAFLNDSGCSPRLVEHERFREMFRSAFQLFKAVMGRHKYGVVRGNWLSDLKFTIRRMIQSCREWYQKHTGVSRAFISTCHDHWDEKRR